MDSVYGPQSRTHLAIKNSLIYVLLLSRSFINLGHGRLLRGSVGALFALFI